MTPLERVASYAQGVIDKGDGSTYNPREGIAYLIYFSAWEGQSAFVNSYLTQAENSMQDYLNNTTPTENNFASYKVLYEWLQENINDRDVIAAIEEYRKYGFNPKMFLNYVAKNFNRFKNKLNHVRASIHNTMTDPTRMRRYEEERENTNDETKKLVDSIIRKVYEECWE
ncbi:MAG: hypothetical protein LUC17_00770 [Oscillospiraceae bacterium]|nr:hypothetical protein [Oscillospiraceae bacterium]